jgi:hypothetical protein
MRFLRPTARRAVAAQLSDLVILLLADHYHVIALDDIVGLFSSASASYEHKGRSGGAFRC